MSIHIKVTLPYLFLLQNKKKEHTTLCMFSFCMWSPILYFEVAIQSFELFRFHFFCNISIDVQCSWNIWMSECVLNDLYIYSSFTHSCRKCMSKRVTAKMWEKHFWIFCFQKLLIIAITDNSSDCFVECCLVPSIGTCLILAGVFVVFTLK